jgi:hypothetical protein
MMGTLKFFNGCLGVLALALMSACGGSQDLPENLANDQSAANDYQQQLFEALPEKQQQEVSASQAALEQALREDFERAKSDTKPPQAFARFADRRLDKLENLNGSLPRLGDLLKKAQAEMTAQQGKGFAEFNLHSAQARLVMALRERQTQQNYLDAAIKADPAVAEAHRRWNADTNAHKTSLAQIVDGLANEPCAFASGGKPGEGRFVLDGVALGMDRTSAIGALCVSKNKDVMLAREGVRQSHRGDYRDFGFSPNSQIAELPWTMMTPFMVMDGGQARNELGKPYQSNAQYCFGCKPERPGTRPDGYAQMRDNIDLRFLPNGMVAGITRTQLFGKTVQKDAGNGLIQPSWEPVPQPLKSLLAPLQQRLGAPSFMWSSGERPTFGWVFPDGQSALPQEKWFLTHAASFDMMQLNTPGFIFDGQVPSRKKLIAARPRAGYCMHRHTDSWGNARHLASKYFTYDVTWASSEAFMAARQAGRTMANNAPVAYSARYEAPGFIDRCGVIVLATFAKDDGIDDNRGSFEKSVQPLSLDAPIYRLTVQMIDTNAARSQFVSEEKAVRARMPVDTSQTPVATVAAGSADAVNRQAGQLRSKDYGSWKACLHKRLGNRFEYEDEVRCQALDPQGRVPRQR